MPARSVASAAVSRPAPDVLPERPLPPSADPGPGRAVRRLVRSLGGTCAAAILYVVACPPREWSAGAWLVPGLLLAATRGLSPRWSLLHGVFFGVGIGYGITGWAYHASLEYFAFHRLLSAAFVASVWFVYCGIPYGLLVACHGPLASRLPGWACAPAGAWLWVLADLLRTTLFTGMPWELLGHTQFRQLTLVQIADLGGVPLVSFVVALPGLAVAELLFEWSTARRRGAGWLASRLAAPAVLLAAAVAYGVHGLRVHGVPSAPEGSRTVALVQANIGNEFRWKRAFFERALLAHASLSARATSVPIDLLVWPENAANFYIDREPLLRAQLGAAAALAPEGLLMGGPRLTDEGEARNSAYLLAGDGRIADVYDKRHLVPLAEYNPFRRTSAASPAEPAYAPGATRRPVETGKTSLGVVICYEVLFPHLVRDLVRAGAGVLVNLSNDAWLDAGDGAAPRQHFSMAVFRAIETRRFLARAAATGVSGFVDPAGRPYGLLDRNTAGTSVATVEERHGLTPYVRWGDTWVVLPGAAVAVLLLGSRRRRPA